MPLEAGPPDLHKRLRALALMLRRFFPGQLDRAEDVVVKSGEADAHFSVLRQVQPAAVRAPRRGGGASLALFFYGRYERQRFACPPGLVAGSQEDREVHGGIVTAILLPDAVGGEPQDAAVEHGDREAWAVRRHLQAADIAERLGRESQVHAMLRVVFPAHHQLVPAEAEAGKIDGVGFAPDEGHAEDWVCPKGG